MERGVAEMTKKRIYILAAVILLVSCAAEIAGVHLHGAAASRLAREGIGPVGLTASETIDAARGVFNGWLIEAHNAALGAATPARPGAIR